MKKRPNDDVRVNDHSTAVMKTKKNQSKKIMKHQMKTASIGKPKKQQRNGEELNPMTKKRNVKMTTSQSNY